MVVEGEVVWWCGGGGSGAGGAGRRRERNDRRNSISMACLMWGNSSVDFHVQGHRQTY